MLRIPKEKLHFETVNVGSNGNWLYEGKPFTGVAYSLYRDGSVRSEETFRYGLKWGPTWEKFLTGALYYEATFYRDVVHGFEREWREDGRLAEEGEYEYGIPLWKKKWSKSGELVEDYRLSESSPAYERLQLLRQTFSEES